MNKGFGTSKEYEQWFDLTDMRDSIGSEDVMDCCQVVSLEDIKTNRYCDHYGEAIAEAVDHQELFDTYISVEEIIRAVRDRGQRELVCIM